MVMVLMGNNGIGNANGTTATAVGHVEDVLSAPIDVGIGNDVIGNTDVADNNEGSDVSGTDGSNADDNEETHTDSNEGSDADGNGICTKALERKGYGCKKGS